MSPSASKAHRAFLPSTNAALAELERVSGKPVLIVDDPALQVLATIRRAGPEQASHLLRLQREGAASDYLITSQCRFLLRGMAQPDRPTQVREKPGMLKRLCSELEALYPSMPAAKAVHGIAALRENARDAPQGCLENAVELEPRNPIALRPLGLMMMKVIPLRPCPT
jgi:hypothetical protein